MDKEQLINFINSLEIEEINSIDIAYFTEKNYDIIDNRDLKVISYGHGINERLDSMRRNIEKIPENLRRDIIDMVETIIDAKLNKKGE